MTLEGRGPLCPITTLVRCQHPDLISLVSTLFGVRSPSPWLAHRARGVGAQSLGESEGNPWHDPFAPWRGVEVSLGLVVSLPLARSKVFSSGSLGCQSFHSS